MSGSSCGDQQEQRAFFVNVFSFFVEIIFSQELPTNLKYTTSTKAP
jgi:hypothetical protein